MSTPITGIYVVAPSVVAVNEPFSLGLRVLTKPYCVESGAAWQRNGPEVVGPFNTSPRGIRYMDNVPPTWRGSVTIDADKDCRGPNFVSFVLASHKGIGFE